MSLQNNFSIDGKTYKQTDGVAMGSPLGPRLANAVVCLEQICLDEFPEDFKPVYYRRHADDIFVLFHSRNHLKFIYEKESSNSLSFLDILKSRSDNGFKTSVYHKPILVGYILTSIVSFTTNINLV